MLRKNKVEVNNIANAYAVEEIRKFNEDFVKLESEINVVKKVNTLFNNRVVDMERQCWANAQYSRRKCLDVVGIPVDVSNKDVESKVLEVFNNVGCEILSRDIETGDCVTNINDRIIVKLLRRKDFLQVMSVKRDLLKIKLEDVGLIWTNPIFIKQNLCPYYRMLGPKENDYTI